MGLLPDDRYDFDSKTLTLEGRRWGRLFSASQRVQIRLVEADGLTGSLVGEIIGESEPTALSQTQIESRSKPTPKKVKSSKKTKAKAGKRPRKP